MLFATIKEGRKSEEELDHDNKKPKLELERDYELLKLVKLYPLICR